MGSREEKQLEVLRHPGHLGKAVAAFSPEIAPLGDLAWGRLEASQIDRLVKLP